MNQAQLAARKQYKREWTKRNKDRVRASARKYRLANKEKYAAHALKRYHTNRTKMIALRRKQRAADPERFKAYRHKHKNYPTATRPCPALCECCGNMQADSRLLALDHCHETGKFRGWLCTSCNTSIGGLGDNLIGVQRAIEYLKRNG